MTDNSRNSAEIVPLGNGRDNGGRFAAGNPGRVPGSKNRVSAEALQAVRSMKDDAIQQLREKLITGDWNAVLFVLERVLPRGRLIELDAATPEAITNALVAGQLTSEEAKNIAIVLEKVASIAELGEMRERLERLERAANGK